MVSDGCGDCATRLPQKTTTQTKMWTKRAIMTSNLRGSMLSTSCRLGSCGRGFGWPVLSLRLPWVERRGKSFLRDLGLLVLVRVLHAAILRQPLQLFAHFYFSVPGILREIVALAGKDEQVTRNIQLVQSAIEQIVLEHSHSNIVRASDDVCR